MLAFLRWLDRDCDGLISQSDFCNGVLHYSVTTLPELASMDVKTHKAARAAAKVFKWSKMPLSITEASRTPRNTKELDAIGPVGLGGLWGGQGGGEAGQDDEEAAREATASWVRQRGVNS